MGTGSTAITLALLDKTVRARVTMCAGATTGPQLSVYPHQGYFARTTFSNTLQAPVLGQLALEDGHSRIAVVGRGDAYGEGFAKVARDALKAAGADVVAYVIYDPQQTNFDAEVQQIAAANPDAIVMVGYEERGKIVRSMIERGIGPKKIGLYTTGLLAAKFWETVNPADASAIQGIKQTAAPNVTKGGFADRLNAQQPGLRSIQFSPEQYDCAIITALAITASKSTEPTVYKDSIAAVTKGDVECTTYGDCVEKLKAGKTIAYVGPGGPTRLNSVGDTTVAQFQIYVVDDKGQSQPTKVVQVGNR
jgi:branched-chain amino acid transport system substrate-binding protein